MGQISEYSSYPYVVVIKHSDVRQLWEKRSLLDMLQCIIKGK